MDEVDSHRRSRFRLFGLFGFWTRHRARQDRKMIEALCNPDGGREVSDAKAAMRVAQAEAQAVAQTDSMSLTGGMGGM